MIPLGNLLAGDVAPMVALWSHEDDVTYMSLDVVRDLGRADQPLPARGRRVGG